MGVGEQVAEPVPPGPEPAACQGIRRIVTPAWTASGTLSAAMITAADGTAHLPGGLTPDEVDLLAAGSLPRSWTARWAAAPQAPVLIDADGWVTTADQLEVATRRVAGRLHRAGLRAGDRLLMSAQPSVALAVVHIAALRTGLVAVPVSPAYREGEIAHIVGDAAPAAAVVDDAERAGWVRAASATPPLLTDPAVDLPDGDPPADLDASSPGDPALLPYTSGTTGRPKGALLSHGNLLASAEALRLAWRWVPDDRLILALPLFHVHGLVVGLLGTLHAGASAVLLPTFDPARILGLAGDGDATLFFGVPAMYTRLLEHPQASNLGRLRLCVSGSAPLPADQFEAIAGIVGKPPLERYGMTETVMLVSNPHDGERRPGSVGLPLPGVEVRLARASDDGVGEIQVRGPNVFAGYFQRPEATDEAFEDGWFRTGDLGRYDPDGYLRIVGRGKDLIISGGYNVYPAEVEACLREHPAVADVAVAGRASRRWGEEVVAYVVAAAGTAPGEQELISYVGERLAPYKRPKAVVFLDALPRNALGKVLRTALASTAPTSPA